MAIKPANEHAPEPAFERSPAQERALINRLLGGDEEAFGYLIDTYHSSLVRLAQSFVSNRATAEEVAQDTWVGVLNGLQAFEGRCSLKTWIFRILANRARSRGRRDKLTVPLSALAEEDVAAGQLVDAISVQIPGDWPVFPTRWQHDTPEQLLMDREAMQVIDEALGELPVTQRAVVTLRDVLGEDSSDVCDVLGISEGNQRVLLHRARTKIRGALDRHMRGGASRGAAATSTRDSDGPRVIQHARAA